LGTITAKKIARHLEKAGQPGQAPGDGADEPKIDQLESQAEPAWVEDFDRRVCQVALARIRGDFDPLVWRAFELTWIEGQASKQAAATVQKPVAWVYKAKFKVLARLKQEVQFLAADVVYFA
jgi:hypothetical protein